MVNSRRKSSSKHKKPLDWWNFHDWFSNAWFSACLTILCHFCISKSPECFFFPLSYLASSNAPSPLFHSASQFFNLAHWLLCISSPVRLIPVPSLLLFAFLPVFYHSYPSGGKPHSSWGVDGSEATRKPEPELDRTFTSLFVRTYSTKGVA